MTPNPYQSPIEASVVEELAGDRDIQNARAAGLLLGSGIGCIVPAAMIVAGLFFPGANEDAVPIGIMTGLFPAFVAFMALLGFRK